jgi:hypothetical protein
VATRRKKAIEEILKRKVGNTPGVNWKIVSTGVNCETATGFSRFMASLMAPLPVLWIRIAFVPV